MTDLTRIANDPDAFEAFYRKHVDSVLRFVARRVGDPHLAADLTADVFLAAIDSASGYQPGRGSPTGWLYGVAHNVVSSHLRRAARELQASSRIAGRRLLDADDFARLEERLDAAAHARRLYLAMDRLPADERSVLELVALDGLAVADAARVLGVRAVTARVRLHRARQRMRHDLELDPVAPNSLAPEVSR